MSHAPFDDELAETLRAEAAGMADAYQRTLLHELPDEAVLGIYLKGSSCRPWESLLDYVPELSDVDVHVRLAPSAVAISRDTGIALRIADRSLASFRRDFVDALHTPRPQLFFLNEIEKLEGYMPSPEGSVRTLHGVEYTHADRRRYSDTARTDAQRLRVDVVFAHEELAGKVLDRPGRLMWDVVARLMWRVAPAGPRVLTQLGMHPFDAWRLNRTSVVGELEDRGQPEIAACYRAFYLAGWAGYRSGFGDDGSAIAAVEAASDLFREIGALVG